MIVVAGALASSAPGASFSLLGNVSPGASVVLSSDGRTAMAVPGQAVFGIVSPPGAAVVVWGVVRQAGVGLPTRLSPDGGFVLGSNVDFIAPGNSAARRAASGVLELLPGVPGAGAGAGVASWQIDAATPNNAQGVGHGLTLTPSGPGLPGVPLRWAGVGTPAVNAEILPVPPDAPAAGAVALDVSADGSVVVGAGYGAGPSPVFRWAAGGVMRITDPRPGYAVVSRIDAPARVSGDGATVLIEIVEPSGVRRAAVWGATTGVFTLPDTTGPGTVTFSSARGVSADGRVVVGALRRQVGTQSVDEAVVWRLVGGDGGSGGGVWNAARLDALLNQEGVNLPPGVSLRAAHDVSDDGTVVAGLAFDAGVSSLRGAIADLTPTAGACCQATTCQVRLLTECAALGGRFGGGGSVCDASGGAGGAGGTECCRSDFNNNSIVNIDDIFVFLNAWFAQPPNPRCDVNANGVVNIDDIFIFLNLWFAGC
jgi:hypothetical protein